MKDEPVIYEPGSWPPKPQWDLSPAGSGSEPPGGEEPECRVTMKCLQVRARGSVSDIRAGVMAVYSGGVSISGRSVINTEFQTLILVFVLLVTFGRLGLIAWFGAAFLLEWFRFRKFLNLRWDDIEEIRLMENHRIACIVYRQRLPSGKSRTFSLSPKMSRTDFDPFAKALYKCAPSSVSIVPNGRVSLLSGSAPWYSALLCGLVFAARYFSMRIGR